MGYSSVYLLLVLCLSSLKIIFEAMTLMVFKVLARIPEIQNACLGISAGITLA